MVRSRRPTLDDVAAAAGVSRMVASRAVNRAPNVSPKAYERVQQAITALGYVQHQGARSLATNRSGTIAFLAPMANHRFFADPNVAAVLGGIKQVLATGETQLITLMVEDEHDAAKAARYLKGRYVDGAVVLSPDLIAPMIREVAGAGVLLAANGIVEGAPTMDSMVLDVRAGAHKMARRLHAAGARRCAVIAGPKDNPFTELSVTGVQDVFGDSIRSRLTYGDHSWQSGQRAMVQLLEIDPDLDGVFVASDVMASAALAVLSATRRPVPGQVRVTGWDDSLPADACSPPLTTLKIPFAEIGRSLAQMLLEQIEGAEGGRIRHVQTKIIARRSA